MAITNAQAQARYRERHPERVKAARKKSYPREKTWHQAARRNPKTWANEAIQHIKYRARSRGLECTINAADIPMPEFCPVLGMKLIPGSENPFDPAAPSVDRFCNDEGYTSNNVRVISRRANVLKNNATADELRRVLAYMEGVL